MERAHTSPQPIPGMQHFSVDVQPGKQVMEVGRPSDMLPHDGSPSSTSSYEDERSVLANPEQSMVNDQSVYYAQEQDSEHVTRGQEHVNYWGYHQSMVEYYNAQYFHQPEGQFYQGMGPQGDDFDGTTSPGGQSRLTCTYNHPCQYLLSLYQIVTSYSSNTSIHMNGQAQYEDADMDEDGSYNHICFDGNQQCK